MTVARRSYRAFVRALAAVDDAAFPEYVSGLRFPAHLRAAYRFAASQPRSVILLPRDHAKTTGAIHYVARRIGAAQGRLKVGFCTASEADAVQRSRAVRALVEHPYFAEVFPWAREGVQGAQWSERAWTVRGAEGYVEKDATLRASSLYGLKPGPRFDLLVCDDLIGPAECTSATQRDKATQRFWAVIEPMVTPEGQCLVLGTRWHEEDLYAELLRKGWPVYLRRAIEDEGGALWPARWPVENPDAPLLSLHGKRTAMGTPLFNLQFQNDPSGMGGNVFRRDWFRPVDRLPEHGMRRVGVDLNASSSERADYTAAVEWLEDAEHNLYLAGAWRAQLAEGHRAWLTGCRDDGSAAVPAYTEPAGPRLLWPTSLLPAGFVGLQATHPRARPIGALNIEATTFQSTFVRELLAHTPLPAHAVHPDTDKVLRARALAARYEAGKVFHLRSAPGLAAFEAELVAFPNGEHDDWVDAAVYGADLGGPAFYFTSARS